jgi:hypothetical protein
MGKKTCKHCGYTWTPRIETEPRACPKCKSPRWNEELRRAGRPRGYTQKEIADIYDRSGSWSPRSRRTVIIANAVSHYDEIESDPYNTKTENKKNTVRAAWEALNEDDSQFELSENQEELFAKGQLII